MLEGVTKTLERDVHPREVDGIGPISLDRTSNTHTDTDDSLLCS